MHDRPPRLSASVFTHPAAPLTGITGVAGYNGLLHFANSTRPGHRHAPRQTWECVGEGIVRWNVEDHRGLRELFDAYRFFRPF